MRDGKSHTNHTPTSTESTRPDLSERSDTLHQLDDFESAINVNLLLASLTNQLVEPQEFLEPQFEIGEDASLISMPKTEDCVDLKPLLFGNSDELFINNAGKVESTCDPAEKANYKNTNYNIIYTPDNLSIAETMEEEFFVQRPYSAENSAQMLDFTFSNNDFVIDSNSVLNGAVCNTEIKIKEEEVIYDTPENTNSPKSKKIFDLPKMDLSRIQIFDEEIRTPDIINSIIEYEKIDLTKQDLPKKVTLTNLIAEDMPSTSSSFLDPSIIFINSPASASSGVSSPASIKKSPKKRYADDSDDDFVDDENDRDYNPYEEETKRPYVKSTKRGRPPKRVKSISSDDYSQLDPEEAKYREMRDRNNEASRRSRYKRKQKEIKVADELTIEEERNVKLKAEVEELQKTVDRFRDSLMKVMLSKR